jgi:hypothetical protein
MDHTQDRVAVANGLGEDADAYQVVDVTELPAAHDHLLVDRVVVLRASGDGCLDVLPPQVVLDLVDHLGEVLVAGRRTLRDKPDDLVVQLGVEGGEGEVLDLPLEGVHAEPVGQRCVDLQRLACDALTLGVITESPHVVEAVGELDDEDPDVLRHRDHHLADGLGLGRFAVLDLVELGQAVDEHRDLVAEVGAQLLQRVGGVLDGVVQEGGTQRRRRHAELGEDRRDRDRMRDVRIAAQPGLPTMPLLCRLVGLLDHGEVGLGVGHPDDPEHGFEDRVARRRPAEAGQAFAHAARRTGEGPARALTCALATGPPRCGGRSVSPRADADETVSSATAVSSGSQRMQSTSDGDLPGYAEARHQFTGTSTGSECHRPHDTLRARSDVGDGPPPRSDHFAHLRRLLHPERCQKSAECRRSVLRPEAGCEG